ncbi:MAG: FFLEELY motif protein [Arenimonas sp.]
MAKRLAWQKRMNDPALEPRSALPILSPLRRWQSNRLRKSFAQILANPKMRPAGEFFLTDLYADKDFTARDRDAAKILPMMAMILPQSLLQAAVDTIELAVVSQAFDLAMAEAIRVNKKGEIDLPHYIEAYREVGCPRLRRHQIDLIIQVGKNLDAAVQKHGVYKLLKASRMPARMAGLQELQGFLERGFESFAQMGGADEFLGMVADSEYEISERLFAGHKNPFAA